MAPGVPTEVYRCVPNSSIGETMARTLDITTAAGLLEERADFLHVAVVPSVSGEGFDVVLRLDGTYSDREGAEQAAGGIRSMIEGLTDVPADRRTWSNGPPWQASR
jgi:hypothetical protein